MGLELGPDILSMYLETIVGVRHLTRLQEYQYASVYCIRLPDLFTASAYRICFPNPLTASVHCVCRPGSPPAG